MSLKHIDIEQYLSQNKSESVHVDEVSLETLKIVLPVLFCKDVDLVCILCIKLTLAILTLSLIFTIIFLLM